MSEIPRSLFFKPRPLPLDVYGKVDFSFEKQPSLSPAEEFMAIKNGERFKGRLFDSAPMLDGGRIILLYRWDKDDTNLSWYDRSHNVFRIDKNKQIIWQIERDEKGCVDWKAANKMAKEDDPNSEGYEDPFLGMSLKFFEERPLPYKEIFNPQIEEVYFDAYAPGRQLWLATGWWRYHLNPETGIAFCTGRQVK